jgi:hypothetical protein
MAVADQLACLVCISSRRTAPTKSVPRSRSSSSGCDYPAQPRKHLDHNGIHQSIGALAGWAGEGKIRNQIDVVEGIENAPDALRRHFTGENLGKQLVKIADE